MKRFNQKLTQPLFSIAIALICCSYLGSATYLTEKPSFLLSCNIYQPGFDDCATTCARTLLKEVLKGNLPELTSEIGSLDPLYLKGFTYQLNNGIINLKANITDIYLRGYSNIEVTNHTVSKNDFSWRTEMFTPLFRIEFKIDVEGKLLGKPLILNDYIILELHNLSTLLNTKTHLVERDGLTFFDIKKVDIRLKPSHVTTNKRNFFNIKSSSENQKSATFNVDPFVFNFLLEPLMTSEIEKLIQPLFKRTFDRIPATFFIPDIPTPSEFYG